MPDNYSVNLDAFWYDDCAASLWNYTLERETADVYCTNKAHTNKERFMPKHGSCNCYIFGFCGKPLFSMKDLLDRMAALIRTVALYKGKIIESESNEHDVQHLQVNEAIYEKLFIIINNK